MHNAPKIKPKYALLGARRRSGFEQKEVALLLGHRTARALSRYESGERLPSLRTAIKLAIIYRTPMPILMGSLYAAADDEVSEKRRRYQTLFDRSVELTSRGGLAEQGNGQCFYASLLEEKTPVEMIKPLVDRHVVTLINSMNQLL